LATSERARAKDGWIYKQSLIQYFRFPSFWTAVPGTIPIYASGELRLSSLQDVMTNEVIATIIQPKRGIHLRFDELVRDAGIGTDTSTREETTQVGWRDELPAIAADNVEKLSSLHLKAIFGNRVVDSVNWLAGGRLVIYWRVGSCVPQQQPLFLASLPDKAVVAIEIHKTVDEVYASVLLNADNELVRWFLRIEKSCLKGECGLSSHQAKRLRDMLYRAARYTAGDSLPELRSYLEGWSDLKQLSSDLLPPETKISQEMFFLQPPAPGK
jgi:hypothetical protein